MSEIEGTYRSLQTPAGTRLGAQYNTGISTLEPGQSLSSAMGAGGKGHNKSLQIRVQGLDDAQEFYELESKADGQTLSSEVFRRINLIESDYFGLEFQNLQMNWVWMEPTKLIVKQVRRPMNTLLRLSVKFFPPDPGQLQEEFTRYLFSLQIKRDLMEGRLNCTENTAALLASHLVQSEIGDYDDIADREFLKINKLLPYQERVQEKILELHRRHIGQTPAESDFQVLEIARKLEMYGVRFHPAADREGTKINLAVAHMGLQVFQGHTKINTFNWSKIRKLSFKRKLFLIKLHPEVHGPHQDTLEFLMGSRDQCKIFWKNCVEHHSFFRLFDQPQPKSKAIFFSRGSSFRYRCTAVIISTRNSKVCMSTRSLASDVPKQNLSFNDSLRSPVPPSSVTASFHSLHAPSSPMRMETPNQPVHLQQTQQPARAPSPVQQDSIETNFQSTYAFPGATHIQAAGDCSPSFVCVESSSFSARPSQNGNEDSEQRYPTDKAYFIAKEILTTERTYLKDLEVITVVSRAFCSAAQLIFFFLLPQEFIREGCLYKLTKKGLQQRMFFLFSDMLLYTSKGVTATNQFKVHGQLPLHGMIVEESENEWSVPHCFTIYSAQRTIVVAASSKVEMNKWIEDLNMAIDMSKKCQEKSDLVLDPSLCDRSNRSSDEVSLEQESEDDMNSSRCSLDKQSHHRANTTMHVCWHRNTSVSMSDHSLAVENQLSGYLLRKFKNSNGWQKLWVVFTNFCLFFYKTHQDDFPLASLPLLGYTVSTPGESDSIHKEYVFKLQFKSHVYFFRAESEYTFERWMEVIKSAASSVGRMSLLVPKVPAEMNGGS
uniref:FERM, RhoGEF and pleckstrin domain protein 2 n=1 Tax=Cyprinus carpio TaxID=7962 RepID=A0A8C2F074_CYPCA